MAKKETSRYRWDLDFGVGGDRLVKEINRLLVLLQLIVGDAQKEVNPM